MTATNYREDPCNIVIIGASGDLSRRKLMPALFSLYCNELLPKVFAIYGFARTPMTFAEFRESMMQNLTCRYVPEANRCGELMDEFLGHCFYQGGNYDDTESFRRLAAEMNILSSGEENRLFYMAIPPSIFMATAQSIGDSGLLEQRADHWVRAVLEKPFGRDSASSAELLESLGTVFTESQSYRIDHYLGKEVIQNLMILRFANLIFEPIWNHRYIERVDIGFSEDIGCEGRAGYFDNYGIIRDVLQNHLIQIMALVGMEQPIRLDAEAIRDEKVKLLRCVSPLRMEDLTVGQYVRAERNGRQMPGYLDDPEVPNDSITPTYARALLRVNNPRWYGVPFYLTCGKALSDRKTEIRIRFKAVPYSIFASRPGLCDNELVIRVQPDEAIELRVVNKQPGFAVNMHTAALDLLYKDAFSDLIPEAYERLLLDVLRGDRSLFLRADELAVSWDIVTPALHQLEERKERPSPYPYGSDGPGEA